MCFIIISQVPSLVRISSLVVPIRKACLTCPVLFYEGVSHVSGIIFLTKKIEGRKYTLLYAVIMCFIIISQVQSKNNKQSNKVTNSTEEQFECDKCFSVDFEILIQNRLM
jgi:Na+/alanine symporter